MVGRAGGSWDECHAICKVLLCHPSPVELLLLQEEQRKKEEHKNGHDIALLTAQTDGQMEPRVNSTKDNHTAPKDSMSSR